MTPGRGPGARRDVARGQLVPLAAVLLLLGALGALGLARLALASAEVARAQDAADAAALAGAVGGRQQAETIARTNGAVVESFRTEPDGTVTVGVRRGSVRAAARAGPDDQPSRWSGARPVHLTRVQRP